MRPNRFPGGPVLLAALCLTAACLAPSRLVSTWKAADMKAGPYHKIMVVGVTPDPRDRTAFEAVFAAGLATGGLEIWQSNRLVPKEQTDDPDAYLEVASTLGLEAVIETHYKGLAAPREAENQVYPVYYKEWRAFYPVVADQVNSPRYYDDYKYLSLETNLYDVKLGVRVWSGASEVLAGADKDKAAASLSREVAARLAADGMIY